MEATLHALGGLLVKAIPTFLLVLCLYLYLKHVSFRPLARVLEARRQATEGMRQQAEELLARAAAKTAEYERALQAARTELYREMEATRQRWREHHARAVAEAREQARAVVAEARGQIQAELELARAELQAHSQRLAVLIADSILQGRVA